MHGAGTDMTMPCRLASPTKFKIGDLHFNQQLYVAPVSCDMILGCDFIIQNKVVMNIEELIIPVQNRNMPLILGDENTAHEPNESDERETQEKPDQCRDSENQCCTDKVESRENLGFYTCPKSGKRERICVQSRTDRKCPVKNCPVLVDRRELKRHCFEEHLFEIFQTYHSTRLMKDSRFHRHRAYVVMLIGKGDCQGIGELP
ncbi:unnamed protein product [Mytilus coruscus]|uniref:Uncharacterized protein n=1 Tax=Mytilus coruscus TaxID=42192 RepID=A0A6J8B3L6_MYTCO|nr:unnamed protein product [Mytilus coruscus]